MASKEFLDQFDELSEKRRRLLEVIEENEFENLLTQLTNIYPDEAHFIYELLQNAEDAGATQVWFFLQETRLAFRHNGTKLFSIEDIKAISNYGNSTKKIESNKIGKFGVGFKSVFAYTRAPIINSDMFTFSIKDTVIPIREVLDESIEKTFQDGITTFILNFDEPSKPAIKAFREIHHGLMALDEKALLFLKKIKKISIKYVTDELFAKTIQKEDLGNGKYAYIVNDGSTEYSKYFLCLFGQMPKISLEELDEENRERVQNMSIALAFELNRNALNEFGIVPIENANVCVFFPAVKEDSGLKFHIHAPFASTLSRDAIRNTDENRLIIEGISRLLVSSIPSLRDLGYLNEGLLSALPNINDRLNPNFEIFRTQVIGAFKGEQEWLPLLNGSYINLKSAVSASMQIQGAVGPFLLAELFKNTLDVHEIKLQYLPDFKNSRAQSFISGLTPRTLTYVEIRNLLKTFMGGNRSEALQKALSSLTIEQQQRFFEVFSSLSAESLKELRELPFIPLNRAKSNFGKPSETYLPSESFIDHELMVSQDLIKPSSPKSAVISGLANLGLRVLDNWEMLDLSITKMGAQHTLGEPVKEEELSRALSDLNSYARAVGRDGERIRKLAGLNIFIGESTEGKKVWTSLNETYIDAPFKPTGLHSVQQYIGKKYRLWGGYASSQEISKFIENSKSIDGVVPEKVIQANGAFDWKINKFEEILETGDDQVLLSIWEMITNPRNEQYRWEVKAEKSFSGFIYSNSSFISSLTYSAWIPTRDGKKHRPTNVSAETLDPRFKLIESKYLKLINFDGSSREALLRQRAELQLRQEKNQLAQELGFKDINEVEMFQKIQKMQPDILQNLFNSLENHFPEQIVDDIEESILMASKAAGSAEEVKIVENVIRERKNYKTNHLILKDFLRATYSLDGNIKCQICNLFMPFKLLSGEDYFEAIYFLRKLPKELKFNGLALCPVCAAKYKYTLKTGEQSIILRIKGASLLGVGTSSIEILLGNQKHQITFTEEHLAALKGIL